MNQLGPDSKNAWRTSDASIDLTRARPADRIIEFPAERTPVRIDLNTTALIVVDMQRFFCDLEPGESDADRASRGPIAPLAALIPVLRRADVPIVWLNWGNRPDQANLPPCVRYPFNHDKIDNPDAFLTRGTPDVEVVSELATKPEDLHVEKYRLSGFWDTPLDSILRGRRINTLFFSGVNLDQCVYHSLADAHFLGYDCILLSDCSATSSPDYCTEATLYNVKACLGFVTESAAVLGAIDAAAAG